MTHDEALVRIAEINSFIEAGQNVWPFLCAEIALIEKALTESLITQDNEQVRGRIKALRDLKELPATLQAERDGLKDGLPE